MPTDTNTDTDLSPHDRNKRLVRRLIDGWNRNDPSVIDEVVAEDCILHFSPPGPARAAWKASFSMTHDAVPDIHTTVEEIVAEGDLVVVRETTTGTPQGEFFGFAPNGRSTSIPTLMMVRIEDDLIKERWAVADYLMMLTQLGHFPPAS